jgi:peptidoglycan hydrolase CwlO-like protein
MKSNLLFLCVFVLLFSSFAFSQTAPIIVKNDEKTEQTLENISNELTQLTKSLQTFNQRINEFLESVNKYKGIQLSEKQQKLLFGYEILNQTEQLTATLRKSLIETGEREATIKRRLGQIQFDLRPENIDRSIQLQGTTKAEEARENRRRTLENERNTLQNLLYEVENSRNQISENLKEAEQFAQSFRKSLFSQIRNAMEDF